MTVIATGGFCDARHRRWALRLRPRRFAGCSMTFDGNSAVDCRTPRRQHRHLLREPGTHHHDDGTLGRGAVFPIKRHIASQ
jgi:hypothetical protein